MAAGTLGTQLEFAKMAKEYPMDSTIIGNWTTIARRFHQPAAGRLPRTLPEQFLQMLLPHRRQRMRSMPARLVALGDEDGFAALYPADFAFEDSQVRRVDQIVGGIDRQQRRPDRLQCRPRVIIARAFDGI